MPGTPAWAPPPAVAGRARVAILLPNEWRGGMLRNAWALAGVLTAGSWPGIGTIEVVVGLLARGAYDWSAIGRDFAPLGPRVTLRRMGWERRPVAGLRRVLGALDGVPDSVATCSVPRDGGHDFLDCDAWVIFSGSQEGFVVPARPAAIYCADLIQRYVPAIFAGDGEALRWTDQVETHLGWRQARCVFATTPQTLADAVSYAGVRRGRALLVPTLVGPIGADPDGAGGRGDDPGGADPGGSYLGGRNQATQAATGRAVQPAAGGRDPYILWITNASPHKNHRAAMAALRIHYAELGGTMPVVVAGADSHLLAPGSGAGYPACRAVQEATDVLAHLRFAGEVSNAGYLRLVEGAAIVWHNVIIDNGTFVAFDAARAGRQFVSSDYPQMRYLCERYGVAALWHPAGDPRAAATCLVEAGRRALAGADPGHALRADPAADRRTAYGALLAMLLGASDG